MATKMTNVPHYDAGFATAIAGYPKTALVSHHGKLWISLSDDNLSEPGKNSDWKGHVA
jgi:hypothetical protein